MTGENLDALIELLERRIQEEADPSLRGLIRHYMEAKEMRFIMRNYQPAPIILEGVPLGMALVDIRPIREAATDRIFAYSDAFGWEYADHGDGDDRWRVWSIRFDQYFFPDLTHFIPVLPTPPTKLTPGEPDARD